MPLIRRQIGLPVYRDRVLVGACGISGSKTDGWTKRVLDPNCRAP